MPTDPTTTPAGEREALTPEQRLALDESLADLRGGMDLPWYVAVLRDMARGALYAPPAPTAEAERLAAMFRERHYKGAPILPHGEWVTNTVMVDREWYERAKEAAARLLRGEG
jgi:hypothetical protein